MSSEIKIEMNRFNGTDYDILLPRSADNPNMIIADTAVEPADPYMSAYIKTLKNSDGDIIYPQTKTSAVYTNDGTDIELILNNLITSSSTPYSADSTYALGAYCNQLGVMYKCTTAITSPEAWNAAHWAETSVGAELSAIIAALSNNAADHPHRNLLDNWDFRDPVNQRGVTSWSSGYGLDRWLFIGGGSITVNSGSVSLNDAMLTHFFEVGWLKAATYTVSVFADSIFGNATVGFYGGANYSSGGWISDGNGLFHVTITVTSNDSTYKGFIYIGSEATNITRVKLELGSVSTLANDPPADYGIELLKCQRYFQTFKTQSLRPTDYRDFRPIMRTNPVLSTITVGADTLYTASADL